ncbi:winged helix family two component transcriptional regulator [Ectopseudomonas oleovorans]|uniref:Winged helix family two component transcriptional regulator n=2 Tax=Pseudomonadaceae TaxID=135621 RepID=A0A397NLY6_ECTOL|nr:MULTISPECIES: response regulator transcription factor [Pseudomonas]QMV64139.1 response regulator transcription factor [Pseudomonas berkeleyensis]RIA34604.1 winged helix family two component transcriptional regulator [Pseudomonas oleovorans]WSO39605.1 response regulator transcription factor [Pseudomonas berkeleyensis]
MIDLIFLEDDPVLGAELADFLGEIGYRVTFVTSLAEFDAAFEAGRHRLAVIDVGLPDGSGLALIEQLRNAGDRLGVVVFSARGSTLDKIEGLGIGADHYLAKGCDLGELSATLEALCRRLELSHSQLAWCLEIGPRRLRLPDGSQVSLSQQDMLVLRCLMAAPGESISRRQIIQALGGDYLSYDQRRLDTQMKRLRRKVLDNAGTELPIKTLRNSGYCFYGGASVRS